MPTAADFAALYRQFNAPVTEFDCGQKCAPFNGGVPVCCDTCHSVPTAYPAEWDYLQVNTDLWSPWEPADPADHARLAEQAGPDLVLIECLGADRCQREYRSLVCRAFPFFPYFDSEGVLQGLSYYWEYEDRCWVTSNLDQVGEQYLEEFIRAHEQIFDWLPEEIDAFRYQSDEMRGAFTELERFVPLLHRSGEWRLVDPQDESMRPVDPAALPKHGPYGLTDRLRFPGETP